MSNIKANDIKLVPIDEIKPNPDNRNIHPEPQIDQLVELIKYQGFRAPLVVSELSGLLVNGHGRLLAARKLGMTVLPVIYQAFDSPEQEYAAAVSDNGIASWAHLDLAGINLDLPEFGPDFDIKMLGLQNFTLDRSEKIDANGEWEGMPEFNQGDKTSFRHVIVHFETPEDAKEFFSLIGQNDTGSTKSIWFPPQERMDTESKRYGDEAL